MDTHDILHAQGFAKHYRVISNRGSHSEVFEREVEIGESRLL